MNAPNATPPMRWPCPCHVLYRSHRQFSRSSLSRRISARSAGVTTCGMNWTTPRCGVCSRARGTTVVFVPCRAVFWAVKRGSVEARKPPSPSGSYGLTGSPGARGCGTAAPGGGSACPGMYVTMVIGFSLPTERLEGEPPMLAEGTMECAREVREET
jgi:hypothetical protein